MSEKIKWIWAEIRRKPAAKGFLLALAALVTLVLLDGILPGVFKNFHMSFASSVIDVFISIVGYSCIGLGAAMIALIRKTANQWHVEELQRRLLRGEVELVMAPIVGIRVNTKVSMNGTNPIYLRYLLGEEEREVSVKDPSLQEAIGCRLPVYLYRDGSGKIVPDPSNIDWSFREEQKPADEVPQPEEETGAEREPAFISGAKSQEKYSAEYTSREVDDILKRDRSAAIGFVTVGAIMTALLICIFLCLIKLKANSGVILILSFILMISVFFLFTGIRKVKSVLELKNSGTILQAVITKVTKGTVNENGMIRYVLFCQAKGQEFKAFTLSPPPDPIGKTIPVLVSSENPKNYIVFLYPGET